MRVQSASHDVDTFVVLAVGLRPLDLDLAGTIYTLAPLPHSDVMRMIPILDNFLGAGSALVHVALAASHFTLDTEYSTAACTERR